MGAIIGGYLRWVWRGMRANWALSSGLTLAMAPVTLLFPSVLAWVTGAVLWLGGSAYASGKSRSIGGWGIICAAIPMAAMAFQFADVMELEVGPAIRDLPVSAAPRYPSASGFEFSAAVVRTELAATYRTSAASRSGGRASNTYIIAPLTPPDWQPSDPVPAWVGCAESLRAACPRWDAPARAAILAPRWMRGNLGWARTLALGSHRLTSDPGAPLLELVDSVEAGRAGRRATLLILLAAGYLAWLIPVLIVALCALPLDCWDHWRRSRAR